MPGVGLANPPGILTPGAGPNGPGRIDARKPVTAVGYADSFGFATPNGVRGFIGPPAGSLRQPTSWYVRIGGSNDNGGSSTSLTPDRTGTDGTTAVAAATLTSATAAFTNADVGKGVCIFTGATARRFKIISVTSSTVAVLNAIVGALATGTATWSIGGAWADLRPAVGDPNISNNGQSGVAAGDTIYLGAGSYRAVVAANNQPVTLTNGAFSPLFNGQVNIVGDVTGQFTGDAGMVQLTAYTTNDKTAPSATTLLNLNGKSNLAFSNIMFVSGNALLVTATTATSQNVSFTDCSFHEGYTGNINSLISATAGYNAAGFGIPLNWLIDRCYFVNGANLGGEGVLFTVTAGVGADYSITSVIRNSFFLVLNNGNATAIRVANSGAGAAKGNGLVVRNCTIIGQGIDTNGVVSASFPTRVNGCFLYVGTTNGALTAAATTAMLESNNLIVASTARSNVSIGAGSITDGSYAPLFHFGQERIWLPPMFRPFGEPMAGSPLLGFGNDGGQTPYDLRSNIRPAGGSSPLPAVGALERADTFVADASPIGGGTSAVKLTGPGYNDFLLPISAAQAGHARTVSVKVKWDASYGGTLPQIMLVAKPQMGVTAQTVAAVGTSGNVYTISLASFTPTAAGTLNVRLISNDLSGASVVEWDDFAIT